MIYKTKAISPIAAAQALTPWWVMRMKDFDGLEIGPCSVIGHDGKGEAIVELCEPRAASFWTVYGHYRTGGLDAFEDFATEEAAQCFHDRLIKTYPHLADDRGNNIETDFKIQASGLCNRKAI